MGSLIFSQSIIFWVKIEQWADLLRNGIYPMLDILFRQIATFLKVCLAFFYGLQTLEVNDFSKIHQLKGLKPKNNDHRNFYECCDLTKKVHLTMSF